MHWFFLLQCIIMILNQHFTSSSCVNVYLVYGCIGLQSWSPFSHCSSSMFFGTAHGCRSEVPGAVSPSETTFCFLFCPTQPLFIVDLHKRDYSNYAILGCFKISSVKGIKCYLEFRPRQVLGTRSESSHILCQSFTRMSISPLANIAVP